MCNIVYYLVFTGSCMTESIYRIYWVLYQNEIDHFESVLVQQIANFSLLVSIHTHGLN